MIDREHRCAVCASEEQLGGIVVGGEELLLCARHLELALPAPRGGYPSLAALLARAGDERRKGPRRRGERRMFPRAEGRRRGAGRRGDDAEV
ncbi:MAG: hypothetical protein R3B72_29445 [Polyangiaceae bacterium]